MALILNVLAGILAPCRHAPELGRHGRTSGMATPPDALDAFAARETNRALLSRASVAEALMLLHEHGMPLHEDTPKNWDGLLAIYHAARTTPRDALVLDAGAETYSAFLPALARLGFTRLLGVNLEFGAPARHGPIEYRFGNIECLGLPDASVGFAASLSVVEHGVELPRFFAEMVRVLLPGGYLFVSTDYWGPGMDTAGVEAYGAPFRTFDARDIVSMVDTARDCGLSPTGPVGTEVEERAVHWKRMDLRYTFHNLLFRKPLA
ncbi:MAG TPA: methyltransferase domain-containing protein [Acetobacteraceae bacterium]|nr:methyltransferase domain-containing protein [Acetobacteraceae bacterium]